VRTDLVRDGKDYRFARDRETGLARHTARHVYREMLLQISEFYSGLPDVRTLTASEIRFFYNGMRASLHAMTKPRPQ
jgi:hypothetical protein